MTYHEKDIDYLDTLPLIGNMYNQNRWYTDWSKENNYLNKVHPASLVGRSLRYVTRRYLHRMPSHRKSVFELLELIGIRYKEEMHGWRYRLSAPYYLDDNDIVVANIQ